ncbi:hypothetical protein [Variovorax ginsengisoli]|uniref:Type IVB pilus formation R64 PilN family outer membrane protein n=1 Tax=Variovorax ginsengisoli TaxID=363844 RepID=A0ABT9SDH8_9BURK|nr:hypothetical protein [Variovorax ginsengisoli]MDP9902408.1 type IVB pilus formation R64 PilN family outer membrane protein [Variovorax ginsengisoli]
MNKEWTTLALLLCSLSLLSACAPAKRISEKNNEVLEQASATSKGIRQTPMGIEPTTPGAPYQIDLQAANAAKQAVARHASRPWIGAKMTAVQSDEMLPPIFTESFKLNFDDRQTNGRVPIAVIAERLTRLTNVPVRIKQDVYGSNSTNGQSSQIASTPAFTGAPIPGVIVPPQVLQTGGPTTAFNTKAALSDLKLPIPDGGTDDSSSQKPQFRQAITDVSSLEMRWDGSLSSFLDHVTGRLNLSWSYRDGVVVIERFISESFELSAFVGTQDYKMSLNGSNSGQGGGSGNTGSASSALDVTESGKISALESLRKSIETMVSASGGSVVLSEGSGRFTVTATKDVMGRVREVLRHEEAAMTRQAHIQIDVYSVTTNDSDERGIDWNVVYQSLSKSWGAVISSPAALTGSLGGSVGYSILKADDANASSRGTQARFGSSSAMLNLLNEISNTAQYRPISMIAMNRQWARKTHLKTDGYLSETTPATASSVGSGAPGLKTSSIVTGDKFLVQPAILDNGVILLKFGVSLTELLSLFDVTTGSGATLQKVQTPVTSGTDDQTTVRLMPGEAMVVTGLSRRLASGDTRKLTENLPLFAGGSQRAGYKREDFLIVVRAVQMN